MAEPLTITSIANLSPRTKKMRAELTNSPTLGRRKVQIILIDFRTY